MLTNMQLYGTDNVPRVAKEVCNVRLRLLHKRLSEVVHDETIESNNHVITQIIKAQNFWKSLRDGEESFE